MPVGADAPVPQEPLLADAYQLVAVAPPVIGTTFRDGEEVAGGVSLVGSSNLDPDA